METSLILAAHKIIPAHVNGMVPFGNLKKEKLKKNNFKNKSCKKSRMQSPVHIDFV